MRDRVYRYFPEAVADGLRRQASLYPQSVDEIRMYAGGPVVLVCGGRNIRTSVMCTADILAEVLGNLCGHSLYAHEETIRHGYIFTSDGIRVGVAGRAISSGAQIERITDISSLCIRIPRRFPGTSDDIYSYAVKNDRMNSLLIFSPPGGGKTTALRELAARLAKSMYRIAVVDTRYELGYGLGEAFMDILQGYPRPVGMEMAVRVLNPQAVICDEISTEADAQAVLKCQASGVAVVASVHGASTEDLRGQKAIDELLARRVFRTLVELRRVEGQLVHRFYTEQGGAWTCADDGNRAAVCSSIGSCHSAADR